MSVKIPIEIKSCEECPHYLEFDIEDDALKRYCKKIRDYIDIKKVYISQNCPYMNNQIYVVTGYDIYSHEPAHVIQAFYTKEEAKEFIESYKGKLIYSDLDYDKIDID